MAHNSNLVMQSPLKPRGALDWTTENQKQIERIAQQEGQTPEKISLRKYVAETTLPALQEGSDLCKRRQRADEFSEARDLSKQGI